MCRTVDVSNKSFNRLKAIKRVYLADKRRAYWLFKCKCGKNKILQLTNVKSGHTKSCGCFNHKKGNLSHHWSGYKDISGDFFGHIKKGAESRNIQFTITIKDLWKLFIKQDKKCSLSGVDLYFPKQGKANRASGNISLDRINSKKGYIKGNIQWVHKTINKIKQTLSNKEFIQWCKIISNNN